MSKRRARRNPGTVVMDDVDVTVRGHRADTKYTVLIVSSDGSHGSTVHCRNIDQCRQVVRVEAPIYGPLSMYVVSLNNKPVETWAVSESGELKVRKHRKQS